MAVPVIIATDWTVLRNQSSSLWRPLNLEIQAGDSILITGPSGCGKSSLLLALAGLLESHRGWIQTGSLDRRYCGYSYLFQNPADRFCANLVRDELAFGVENDNLDLPTITNRVDKSLSDLSITTIANRQINCLSGGEQQRVALAGILAEDRGCILIDEALSQLDSEGRNLMMSAFDSWRERHPDGVAIIVDHRKDLWAGRHNRRLCWHSNTEDTGVGPGSWIERPVPDSQQLANLKKHTKPQVPVKYQKNQAAVLNCRELVLADPSGHALPGAKPLNLSLYPGEICILQGPNGAGKSALLKTLAGWQAPARGWVELQSRRMPGMVRRKADWAIISSRMGFCLQNPELQFGAGTVSDHCDQDLEWLDLQDRWSVSPFQLSLGQQRRLSLAMIMPPRPVMLLDEPFYGQDALASQNLMDYIRGLAEGGSSVLMVCHDEDVAQSLGDRLFMLNGGQLMELQGQHWYPWWEGSDA